MCGMWDVLCLSYFVVCIVEVCGFDGYKSEGLGLLVAKS